MMHEPQFAEDLAARLNAKEDPVPEIPKKVLKKRVPNFLKTGVYRSAILHVTLLVAFPLVALISRWVGWDAEREARLRMMQLHKSAIRVDMVDLPSLKLSDLEKVDLTKEVELNEPPAPGKDEKSAEAPKISETAMIDRTQKELEKKKAQELAKQKRLEEERRRAAEQRVRDLRERLRADQRRKELIAKLKTGEGRPALGGNVVSEGYSTSGDVAVGADAYHGKARAHVQKHWAVPGWMSASNLSASILVKIAPDGRVITKEFLKQSGNPEFDRYVERAIEMADPFPPPPDSLKITYMEEGIEWGFPN